MAKFQKGNKIATGRPKGVPNKTTTELKETINKIVSITLDNYLEDLAKIRKEDPKKAMELSKGLIEYIMPKMTKVDISGELKHKVDKITIEIKNGNGTENNNN